MEGFFFERRSKKRLIIRGLRFGGNALDEKDFFQKIPF
jgi:hypothetical protein